MAPGWPQQRPASPASCKTPVTFIDSICPNNHPEINELPANGIKLHWPTYTEPRVKKGTLHIKC